MTNFVNFKQLYSQQQPISFRLIVDGYSIFNDQNGVEEQSENARRCDFIVVRSVDEETTVATSNLDSRNKSCSQ